MPNATRSRRRLLNLLALLLGLAFIGGVELSLQFFDIGPSSRLFLPTTDQGEPAFVINPQAAHRFFQPQYLRHVPFDARFAAVKPQDTVRIFALGASTLVGFPNPASTAFPHFLERMLADAFPAKRFEVVNCGITAINTFCLLDFAQEILEYQPDLILIYAGHNEFVGPYGATTPFMYFGDNRRLVRVLMYLQRARLYGLLRDANRYVQQRLGTQPAEGRFGLHLATREIDILAEGYRLTGENYRRNLAAMVEGAAAAKVPVMLSTLVSNLKDFYPLRSDCAGLEGIPTREEDIKAALAQAPYCAALHFSLGQYDFQRGQSNQAHQAFVRARDMDRLPFRAPTFFNQILRQVAGAHEHVLLSDLDAVFAAASPQGIIGRELITEHLHPTVYGHYLMAASMVKTLAGDPLSRLWGAGELSRLKPYEAYASQVGYTLAQAVDRRNTLMLFLRQMPYEQPPAVLQDHLAELIRQQLRDIPRLSAAEAAAFKAKGGGRFLRQMLAFVAAGEQAALRREIDQVMPGQ